MSKRIVSDFLSKKSIGDKLPSPKVNFTMALLEWLPIKDFDYEISHASLPNLKCRVRSGGKKTIRVIKRVNDGSQKRITLCAVGERTLADITADYHKVMNELSSGVVGGALRPDKATLSGVMDSYINDTHLAPKTIETYRSVIRLYLSDWADKPLISITPDKVKTRFDEITNKKIISANGKPLGGPSVANTTMKVIRALFNFMQEEAPLVNGMPSFPPSPTLKLNPSKGRRKKKSSWNIEKPREGRIELSQLKDWWLATEALATDYLGNGELARDYLQFVLLTGMRRREVTGLEWSNITKTSFTVRGTKNGTDHELPLTEPLNAIIANRKGGTRPFPIEETRRFTAWVIKRSGVQFTIHDLRRTFAGYAEHQCELPEKIISVLLNHTTNQTITSRYIGETGLQKKAEKLEVIQNFILKAVSNKSNIITMEVLSNG